MTQVMDVIVVGCGASGIAALRKLYDAGLKVMGLEATDEIGGRIRTVQFGDCATDAGAAWCHGEKDNLVFELANPFNLLGRPEPGSNYNLLSSGELVSSEKGQEILGTLDKALGDADKDNDKSISEFVRELPESNSALQNNPSLTASFIEWFERNSHVGGQTDPKKGKSLRGLAECWGCDGEFMLNWKGRGYKTILDVLLSRYPDPSQEIPVTILTNKEVESIKWKASQPGFDPESPLVQVKCKDGSLYAARSVIVTVSVGVLKDRYEQLFNPPLPSEKINAIKNLQMCVLDKIYVEFSKPWWPTSPSSFNIIWREEDKDKFSNKDKWLTEIYGFLTVDYQPDVLLFWIYGEGAKAMEKLSEDEVKIGMEKLFHSVLRKQFDVTPIKNILRTQWASNQFARGAYAYRSVACEQNGGDAVTLSEPLYSGEFPLVCFAGEATSHRRHGAVHGAIDAGFREANRLIDVFGKLRK